MNTFTMHLQSATQYECVEQVESFVGEDDSGHFGMMAKHARAMTVLRFGLARFRATGANWEYLALPGATVYFTDNALFVNTRRYVRDTNYARIVDILRRELVAEEKALHEIKQSVHQLEEQVQRRLWKMRRSGEVGL